MINESRGNPRYDLTFERLLGKEERTMNEIDRQAAEVVMGFIVAAQSIMGMQVIGGGFADYVYIDGKHIAVSDWSPSTKISQALGDGGAGTVVGRLRKTKDIIVGIKGNFCFCEIRERSYPVPMDVVYVEANTPAAAITEAAVTAVAEKGENNGR